jgi:cytochrome c-type biogenesis protein CcmF
MTENSNPLSSRSWLRIGRGGFIVHTLSVISIFATLFYIIEGHLFEYHYAYEHSSLSLPPKYLLSCFWEGQEGSFMLWTFWHSVLGLIVMRTAKSLETRTMTIIAMVQVILSTMILGFYLGPDIKIGSTPFMLLRNAMRQYLPWPIIWILCQMAMGLMYSYKTTGWLSTHQFYSSALHLP